MTKRITRTMTDDQLRVALSVSTLAEIEAALAAGDLTPGRMAQVATPTRRAVISEDAITTRETGKLSLDNNATVHEPQPPNDQLMDILKQLKSNKRS